jgi:hypothetical protein
MVQFGDAAFRCAVKAPEVAAVGDGNPKVVQVAFFTDRPIRQTGFMALSMFFQLVFGTTI